MTAVAHFPTSLDKGPLGRLRRPLAGLAATILVVDLMGLGMHLADSAESPLANDAPTHAKARVRGPEALVPSDAHTAVAGAHRARVQPTGCLALASGCYAGPPAPPSGSATQPPSGGTTTPTPTKPLAQANLSVPALGANASLGLGDGSCTGLGLTALSVGNCPVATGDGPVVINLGGTLLGS